MHNHGDHGGFGRHKEAWRLEREAKRAAWRARRAARHAGRGDWSHFSDPKFWGLDAESMKQWGMGDPSSEVAQLQAKVADMEKIIASLRERVIVLEKLVVDDERRLATEIEKLRDVGARKADQ